MINYTTNEQGQPVATFTGTLVSVNPTTRTNKNGTEYRFGIISFKDENNESRKVTTNIYEKNFQLGMKVGEEYLTRTTKTETGYFTQTSHLQNAGFATEDMFDFSKAIATSKVDEKEVAKEFAQ